MFWQAVVVVMEDEVFRAAVIMVNRARGVWPREAGKVPLLDLDRPYDGRNRWVRMDGVVCLRELEARVYMEVVYPCLFPQQEDKKVLEVPDASRLPIRKEEEVLWVLLLAAAVASAFWLRVPRPHPLDHWLAGWFRGQPLREQQLLQQLLARGGLWRTLERAMGGIPIELLPQMMVVYPDWCTERLLRNNNNNEIPLLRPLCAAYFHALRHHPTKPLLAPNFVPGGWRQLQLPLWSAPISPLFSALAQQAVPHALLCDVEDRVVCGVSGIVVPRDVPALFAALEAGLHPDVSGFPQKQKRYMAWLLGHAALVWYDRPDAVAIIARLLRELDVAEEDRVLQLDLVRHHQQTLSEFWPCSPLEEELCIRWAPRWWFAFRTEVVGGLDAQAALRIIASQRRGRNEAWQEAELADTAKLLLDHDEPLRKTKK